MLDTWRRRRGARQQAAADGSNGSARSLTTLFGRRKAAVRSLGALGFWLASVLLAASSSFSQLIRVLRGGINAPYLGPVWSSRSTFTACRSRALESERRLSGSLITICESRRAVYEIDVVADNIDDMGLFNTEHNLNNSLLLYYLIQDYGISGAQLYPPPVRWTRMARTIRLLYC